MDIDVFPARALHIVFRVLRTALNPADPLAPRERQFLDTYARITGYLPAAADPLPVIAQHVDIDDAHQRKRLIQLSAIAALLSQPVKAESVEFLKKLSRHLDTHDSVIDVLEALLHGRRLKARMLTMRRGLRALLKEAYNAEGAMGVLHFLSAMFLRTPANRDNAWDYKDLGLMPEGTLGREYWKHMVTERFGFPGEPAGIPNSVAYHDIAHVLAGNNTTPLGEIQQGSFQGGNRREDGFFFIQFVILHFHHGVTITPMAPPQLGNFHPDKVLWAIHRGAKCSVDMTHQWNFWPLMALPLADARRICGVLPKLPATMAGVKLTRIARVVAFPQANQG